MNNFFDYYFTGKTKIYNGVTVHQIARIGDNKIGGYIEKRDNLVIQNVGSPAWVGESAIVYGSAIVDGAAIVDGSAVVCGNSHITYGAHITGCAQVVNSKVCGISRISHQAFVENSTIEDSVIESSAKVKNAKVKFCKFKGWADLNGGEHYNRRYDGQYWWK